MVLKGSDNPPALAPWVRSVEDLQERWWVGHTKARAEKALAWGLLKRNIGYFLPLIDRVTISGGRKRHVMLPLFSSYVFFCGSEEDRYAAMTTDHLARTISVSDQELLTLELSSIEKALAGKAKLDPYPFAAVGRRCRVRSGPFEGLEGVVVRRNNVARLVLHISILAQGAAIELDADLLEPAD